MNIVSTMVVVGLVCGSLAPAAWGDLVPARLRCKYLDDLLGIDVEKTRLSWLIEQSGQRTEADGLSGAGGEFRRAAGLASARQ